MNKPYYPVLEGKIVERGISKADIAKTLNISISTLSNKLTGKTDFWRKEALLLRDTFFPDIPADELFTTT